MECTMVKNPDEIKGRVKEAAGSLTGNKKLKSEGKAKKAEVKVERLIDKAKDARPKK
jgi:uncharacterized protein YjbJ (UPF0337 family)